MYSIDQLASMERPVGSDNNNLLNEALFQLFSQNGYDVKENKFICKLWHSGKSYIDFNNKKYEVYPSAFTKGYSGTAQTVCASTIEALENIDLTGKIVFMTDELTKEELLPKNFPFFINEENKRIIETLEKKEPVAVIALMGKHAWCNLNPCHLIEDGNFLIPSASLSRDYLKVIDFTKIKEATVYIDSENKDVTSRQLVASKKATGKKVWLL